MGWPQITVLTLMGLNLLAGAYLHGKERKGEYNFWPSAIGVVLMVFLLIQGGFFG